MRQDEITVDVPYSEFLEPRAEVFEATLVAKLKAAGIPVIGTLAFRGVSDGKISRLDCGDFVRFVWRMCHRPLAPRHPRGPGRLQNRRRRGCAPCQVSGHAEHDERHPGGHGGLLALEWQTMPSRNRGCM